VLPVLKKLDNFLYGRKFAAGSNLTYIDFGVFELEELVKAFDEKSFNGLANLKVHHVLISEIPQIKVDIEDNYLRSQFSLTCLN